MNEENIVSLALKYYDKQKNKHLNYYSSDYQFDFSSAKSDTDLPKFIIKKNNKTVLNGHYNIIGIYFKKEKKFVWGWGVCYNRKNATYLSRQMLLYGLDMNPNFLDNSNYNNIMLDLFIKNDLTNKEIMIEHPVQLEQYLALGLYLTKSDMIYKSEDDGDNVVTYKILKYTDL